MNGLPKNNELPVSRSASIEYDFVEVSSQEGSSRRSSIGESQDAIGLAIQEGGLMVAGNDQRFQVNERTLEGAEAEVTALKAQLAAQDVLLTVKDAIIAQKDQQIEKLSETKSSLKQLSETSSIETSRATHMLVISQEETLAAKAETLAAKADAAFEKSKAEGFQAELIQSQQIAQKYLTAFGDMEITMRGLLQDFKSLKTEKDALIHELRREQEGARANKFIVNAAENGLGIGAVTGVAVGGVLMGVVEGATVGSVGGPAGIALGALIGLVAGAGGGALVGGVGAWAVA